MKIKAMVPGPWGPAGSEWETNEPNEEEDWHLMKGALVEVKAEKSKKEKEKGGEPDGSGEGQAG